jgi:hypothetical protein
VRMSLQGRGRTAETTNPRASSRCVASSPYTPR